MSKEPDEDDFRKWYPAEKAITIRVAFEPLYISDAEIGRRLGIGLDMWPRVKMQFEREGWPSKDSIINKRYWPAVEHWLNHRHGITNGEVLPPDGKDNFGPYPPRTYQKRRRIKD